MKSSFVIVNPAAAHGALKAAWESLARALQGKIRHFEVAFTTQAGDAERLARRALKEGFTKIIAVGGDGTLAEAVNGFFEHGKPVNPSALVGILPFGRGSDLARGLGLPRDPAAAMARLKGSKYRALDVGRGIFHDASGRRVTRYFINIANVGIVSNVDNWSHRAPRLLGAKGAYVFGAIIGAVEYRAYPVIYSAHGVKREVEPLNIVIANGKYFGSGMKPAPRAVLDDGLFDIVVTRRMSLWRLLGNLPKLYAGEHLNLPEMHYFRDSSITIRTRDPRRKMAVEMDGDTVGVTPVTFTVLPKCLRFKI